jgi:hypothetical protein
MADESDYETAEAVERAEKVFSSGSQKCSALCRELRLVDQQLEQAAANDAPAELIDQLNARFLAIVNERKRLGCAPCNLP